MKSWNHRIERVEAASWYSCGAMVKAKPGSPFAGLGGLEPCAAGKREYRATYCVTGKGGRVVTRVLYFCEEHARAWARKHGVDWCPDCARTYGDTGVCDQGKPQCSPHRKPTQELECNCDQPNQVQCDLHGPRE